MQVFEENFHLQKKKKDLRRMKMTVCRVGSYEVGLVIMEKNRNIKINVQRKSVKYASHIVYKY